MHESGNHERCQFGCSPDNPQPNQMQEFENGVIESSRELAAKLGRDDARVALALDALEYLATLPRLPDLILMEIGSIAALADDLSGTEPDSLDLLKVRRGRRILDEAKSGIYHN